MKKEIKTYIVAIIIPLLVGGLSALLTMGSMDIYSSIIRPPLSPPAIVFPIVWTVLYILMGISSAMIYNSDATEGEKKNALTVYAIQLIINFFWSIIFFNLRAYLFSFILLVVLWILVLVMILKFAKINKTAAILQIPYLLWLTFAGYLSLMIYILNR